MQPRRPVRVLCWAWVLAALLGACAPRESNGTTGLPNDWNGVLQVARGQTVNFYLWGGNDRINAYIDGYVEERAQRELGVTVNRIPVADTAEAVNKVLGEKAAGRDTDGSVDLIWINGENFRTLRQADLLHCGYTGLLPNDRLIDWSKPSVANDAGTPVEGCEVPWTSAQFVMIYDAARVAQPPSTIQELQAWARQHPGQFTYPAPPDFTGSAFVRHVVADAAGGFEQLQGPFDQARFDHFAPKAWATLNAVEPFLWRGGETYPNSSQALHDLYANGEVAITLDYDQGIVPGLVDRGTFPRTTRTATWSSPGSLGNSSYTAIPYNSPRKPAAMALQNLLLSPEAQAERARPSVWGTYPVIDLDRLESAQRQVFESVPVSPNVLGFAELYAHGQPEPRSQWITAIEDGWRTNVLQR